MTHTVAKPSGALERLNSATPCGTSAKAELRPHTPACDMRAPAKEALKRTTKQELAAEGVGITQSRLSHKFADGSLKVSEMEAFGPSFAAEYGRQLVEHYGPLSESPQARIRQKARELRQLADEIEQFAEFIT